MAIKIKDKYICNHKTPHKKVRILECLSCKKTFERPSCFPKGQKFCSSKCSGISLREKFTGTKSSNFKHGQTYNGYKRISTVEGRNLEHRVVMEKTLGRKLLKTEWVHHINGDKLDNRPENLILVLPETHFSDITCPNCKYHFLIK